MTPYHGIERVMALYRQDLFTRSHDPAICERCWRTHRRAWLDREIVLTISFNEIYPRSVNIISDSEAEITVDDGSTHRVTLSETPPKGELRCMPAGPAALRSSGFLPKLDASTNLPEWCPYSLEHLLSTQGGS